MKPVAFALTVALIGLAATTGFGAPQDTEKVLFNPDFTGEKGGGGFAFQNWGGSNLKYSGGLTGNKTTENIPAKTLEVIATNKGMSGWQTVNAIKLPAEAISFTLIGKVFRSADYRGNRPMVMIWCLAGNRGKPLFFEIKKSPDNQWQNFEIKIQSRQIPDNCSDVQIALISIAEKNSQTFSGRLYFKDIIFKTE